MPTPDELRRDIEGRQKLPMGHCALCGSPTRRVAFCYARLEIPEAGQVIWLPVCRACADSYLTMIEAEQPAPPELAAAPNKLRKSAS